MVFPLQSRASHGTALLNPADLALHLYFFHGNVEGFCPYQLIIVLASNCDLHGRCG